MPCIAEYGDAFAAHLAESPIGRRVPYLREFAECDWHLGRVAVSVDRPTAGAEPGAAFSGIPAEAVANTRLVLQAGTHYLRAAWPIDTLIALFVGDKAPDRVVIEPGDVHLEIRGSRGAFWLTRLEAADFAFRQGLHAGQTLSEAAERGWGVNESFEPGRALAAMWAAGLVTAVTPAPEEGES